MICFNCKKKNHIAKYCKFEQDENFSSENEKFKKAFKFQRKKIKKQIVVTQFFSSDLKFAA